jgi:hypothetical protein
MSDLFSSNMAPRALTRSQRQLLIDLAALSDAKLIAQDETVLASDGYDAGSSEIEVPGTLTFKGWEMVRQIKAEPDDPI